MTRIDKIRVEGLAGRRDPLEFPLHPVANVLFGRNGTGKTSLLKILASALRADVNDLTRVPFVSAKLHVYSHDANSTSEYVVHRPRDSNASSQLELPELAELNLTRDAIVTLPEAVINRRAKYHMQWRTNLQTNPPIKRLRHLFLQTSRLISVGDARISPSKESVTELALDELFERTVEREWLHYWAELQYRLQQVQQEGLQTIVREILMPSAQGNRSKNLDPSSDTTLQLVSSFLKRNTPEAQIPNRSNFYRKLEEDLLFRSLIANVQFVEQKIRELMHPTSVLRRLLIGMFMNKTPDFGTTNITIMSGETKLRLSQLSSGEKHLLRILFSAMLHGHQSCILIDEPELSLHIDWQRALVAALKEIAPSSQLILATHSPEIMAEVPDDQIVEI